MSPNTMDSEHYFAPPPAYSEQEFDQKISHATNLSVQTAQLERRAAEGDGWEPYDPKAFEAEVTKTNKTAPAQVDRLTADTTTTSWHTSASSISVNQGVPAEQNHSLDGPNNFPSVQPLRIEKKSSPKSNVLDVHGLHATTNYSPASSTSHHKGSLSVSSPFSTPPSFADQVNTRISAAIPTSEGVLPEGTADDYRHSLVDPYYTAHATSPRQSLPPPIRPHVAVPERPMSYSPSSSSPSPSVPRIDFNPYVAYGNSAPTPLPVQTPPRRPMGAEISYDPNAFYNSAVSAQLTPSRPSQPYPSPLSGGNLPQYQDRNASYPTQDGARQQPFNPPFRPVRPPAHGVNNSPRQALWQTSARPVTSHGGSDTYLVPESNRHPNNRNSVYSNHSNR